MAAVSAVALVGSLGAYAAIQWKKRNRRARERKALAASQAAGTAASAEPNSHMPTDFHAQAPTNSNQR
jgi:type II secretory pathway pseudopilin PulG